MNRPAILLLALLPLAACSLVDQTSFGAAPRPPAPDQLAAALASSGAEPLLTIRPDQAVPYADSLRRVLATAEAGAHIQRYRLVTVLPASAAAGPVAGDSATLYATRQVLDDMAQDGVTPDRVTLSATTSALLPAREIRLFLDATQPST